MIAKTQKVGKSSVSEVFRRAKSLGLSYQDIKEWSEKDTYRHFFP